MRLLIDRCPNPGRNAVQMANEVIGWNAITFGNRLHDRFEICPLRRRNTQFFPQLTDQCLFRLLTRLHMSAKHILYIWVKCPLFRSTSEQNVIRLNDKASDNLMYHTGFSCNHKSCQPACYKAVLFRPTTPSPFTTPKDHHHKRDND